MTEKLTPNALAAELDKRAKQTPPDVDGLPDNEMQYVLHVYAVLQSFKRQKVTIDYVQCQRRWYQIKYLQKPGMEEIIESWTTLNS